MAFCVHSSICGILLKDPDKELFHDIRGRVLAGEPVYLTNSVRIAAALKLCGLATICENAVGGIERFACACPR